MFEGGLGAGWGVILTQQNSAFSEAQASVIGDPQGKQIGRTLLYLFTECRLGKTYTKNK